MRLQRYPVRTTQIRLPPTKHHEADHGENRKHIQRESHVNDKRHGTSVNIYNTAKAIWIQMASAGVSKRGWTSKETPNINPSLAIA